MKLVIVKNFTNVTTISIFYEMKTGETKVSIIHKFDYKDCEIWFVRFSMDAKQKILALGNQVGKTYLWDMDTGTYKVCSFQPHFMYQIMKKSNFNFSRGKIM